MSWYNFVIPLIFVCVVGIVIWFFISKDKGMIKEIRQDKTFWYSMDLNHTRGYIFGTIESRKKINGNIVLLLQPKVIGLNEKSKDVKAFPICVTETMITESNKGRNPLMIIQPYLSGEFEDNVKKSEFFKNMVDNRTALSVKDVECKMLTKQLVEFTNSVPKSIQEPYSNILQDKFKTKKKIDEFNGSMNSGYNPSHGSR